MKYYTLVSHKNSFYSTFLTFKKNYLCNWCWHYNLSLFQLIFTCNKKKTFSRHYIKLKYPCCLKKFKKQFLDCNINDQIELIIWFYYSYIYIYILKSWVKKINLKIPYKKLKQNIKKKKMSWVGAKYTA